MDRSSSSEVVIATEGVIAKPTLNASTKNRAYALIRRECCNLDGDGYCLPLDTKCPQMISESIVCKWFRNAVLPLDKELDAVLNNAANMKKCERCRRLFVPTSNRAKYCVECAGEVRRAKEARRKREARASVGAV